MSVNQGISNTPTPTFCPWCGPGTAISPTTGEGFTEYGEYDGRGYCWEGNIPGWYCGTCTRSWLIEPSYAEIHEDCSCEDNSTSPDGDETDPDDEHNAEDQGDEDKGKRTCVICEKSGGALFSSYVGDVHIACALQAEKKGGIVR